MNQAGGDQVVPRSRDEVAALFGDLELLEPGLVGIAEWRPSGPGDISNDPVMNKIAYAGVARKP